MSGFFDSMEYQTRLARTQEALEEAGIDTLLVHIPENIYYLSGHQTIGYYAYQCLAVPRDGPVILCVRDLERELAKSSSWLADEEIVGYCDTDDPVDTTLAALHQRGLLDGQVAIEGDAWFVSVDTIERFKTAIERPVAFRSGTIESCRVVKSAAEVDCIKPARSADAAVDAALSSISPGVRESDVAAKMYEALISSGSEYTSLPLFIASGPRSAIGHATWSDRVIEDGDTVFLKTCGAKHRYSAAIIRTAVVGALTDRHRRIEEALQRALDGTIAAMTPGTPASEVDRICRTPVIEAGFGDYFKHRAGYSIGVNFPPDWGEGHIASIKANATFALAAGMVFHMIPAAIIPGEIGVGLSETVLVTDAGGVPLTNSPRRIASL